MECSMRQSHSFDASSSKYKTYIKNGRIWRDWRPQGRATWIRCSALNYYFFKHCITCVFGSGLRRWDARIGIAWYCWRYWSLYCCSWRRGALSFIFLNYSLLIQQYFYPGERVYSRREKGPQSYIEIGLEASSWCCASNHEEVKEYHVCGVKAWCI